MSSHFFIVASEILVRTRKSAGIAQVRAGLLLAVAHPCAVSIR
ncbi:hypothetical protein [Microbulbifer okhotskensis]|nr:hypothetical protein [Microbulbifer okhotskensis]